jgi:hypothetical protein
MKATTIVFLLAVGVVATACTQTIPQDVETPPASVPSASTTHSDTELMSRGGGDPVASHGGTRLIERDAPASTARPTAPERPAPPVEELPPIPRPPSTFRASYAKAGSPRIAVFLNRQLSAEVREWRTDRRLVISGESTKTRTEGEGVTKTTKSGSLSGYEQRHLEDTGRRSPEETWMWVFEERFLNPFLEQGCKMVDRATIMRLAALASGTQGSAGSPMAVKAVEMKALVNHADLFIELLVAESKTAELGYVFKATVKEVKTGIIVANVSSVTSGPPVRKKTVQVATDEGWDFETKVIFPSVDEVTACLTAAVMKTLERRWND